MLEAEVMAAVIQIRAVVMDFIDLVVVVVVVQAKLTTVAPQTFRGFFQIRGSIAPAMPVIFNICQTVAQVALLVVVQAVVDVDHQYPPLVAHFFLTTDSQHLERLQLRQELAVAVALAELPRYRAYQQGTKERAEEEAEEAEAISAMPEMQGVREILES